VRSGKNVILQVRNTCHVPVNLVKTGGNGPAAISVPARSTAIVRFTTAETDTPLDLPYTVTNFLIAPGTGLPVVLRCN
jgi:hypothetical protein